MKMDVKKLKEMKDKVKMPSKPAAEEESDMDLESALGSDKSEKDADVEDSGAEHADDSDMGGASKSSDEGSSSEEMSEVSDEDLMKEIMSRGLEDKMSEMMAKGKSGGDMDHSGADESGDMDLDSMYGPSSAGNSPAPSAGATKPY